MSLNNGECHTYAKREGQLRKKVILWVSVYRVVKHTSRCNDQTLHILTWLSDIPSAALYAWRDHANYLNHKINHDYCDKKSCSEMALVYAVSISYCVEQL